MHHAHQDPEHQNHTHASSEKSLGDYQPLIVIAIFCLLLPLFHMHPLNLQRYMCGFMGYFFIFLSLFKFFNLEGFIDGFSTYDLIAQRFRVYGYAYPFIEFALGASYLAEANLKVVSAITLLVMLISGLGVVQSIRAGKKLKCACLGTVLNVPLSTVSVIENLGMGLMAAMMLFFH